MARVTIGLAAVLLAACGDQVVGEYDATSSAGSGDSTPVTETGAPTTFSPSEDSSSGDASTGAHREPTTSGVIGGDESESSSDGTPSEPEQCDGIDNDGDGLIDEVGPALSDCNGCMLAQSQGQAWWACPENLTWSAARDQCEAWGAHLAVIPDQASQDFVLAQFSGIGIFFWIGGLREDRLAEWMWIDGSPFDFAAWGNLQPDNIDPGQFCVRYTFGLEPPDWFDGAWDDFFCDDVQYYMCSSPHALP